MRIFLAVLSALSLTSNAYADRVNIYVASSVSEVMDEILAGYDPGPGNEVVAVYAGTSTLARQIDAGAPADLILFANAAWADYLSERNRISAGTRKDLLTNSLVLVSPRMAPLDYEDGNLVGVLGGEQLAIADPEGVPAGIYAREALETTGEWNAAAGQMVYGESARTVVNWVARSEVAAGIVYASDAYSSFSLSIEHEYPPNTHSQILYPLAMTPAGEVRPEVIAFYNYLRSQRAEELFRGFGFGFPPDD